MSVLASIKGIDTLLDRSSLHFLYEYIWLVEPQSSGIYFMATYKQKDGTDKKIKLHRLICGATKIEEGMVYNLSESVDHINRDTLNNTKDNLRLCTKSQNAMNSKIPLDNTSGHKGVSWKKDKQKWKAYATVGGKQIHLGYFTSKEAARKARIEGAKRLFGEFFAECIENA